MRWIYGWTVERWVSFNKANTAKCSWWTLNGLYTGLHCIILSTFLFEHFHNKMFKRNKILKPTSRMCALRMATS